MREDGLAYTRFAGFLDVCQVRIRISTHVHVTQIEDNDSPHPPHPIIFLHPRPKLLLRAWVEFV